MVRTLGGVHDNNKNTREGREYKRKAPQNSQQPTIYHF
jgi:hypothetical protein